jgi:hypothetical protein
LAFAVVDQVLPPSVNEIYTIIPQFLEVIKYFKVFKAATNTPSGHGNTQTKASFGLTGNILEKTLVDQVNVLHDLLQYLTVGGAREGTA